MRERKSYFQAKPKTVLCLLDHLNIVNNNNLLCLILYSPGLREETKVNFIFEQETSRKLQRWSKMKMIKKTCYRAILIDSESKRDAEFDYDGVSKRDGDVERWIQQILIIMPRKILFVLLFVKVYINNFQLYRWIEWGRGCTDEWAWRSPLLENELISQKNLLARNHPPNTQIISFENELILEKLLAWNSGKYSDYDLQASSCSTGWQPHQPRQPTQPPPPSLPWIAHQGS